LLVDGAEKAAHLCNFRNIGRLAKHAAEGGHLGHGAVHGLARAPANRHRGALAQEAFRDSATDSARAAGDDGDLSREWLHPDDYHPAGGGPEKIPYGAARRLLK